MKSSRLGKIPDRRTEITYKAVIGGRLCTTRRSPILPEPISVDVAVTEGRLSFLPGEVCKICSRQEGIKGSHSSKLCRKAAVELTEVSFTHSTDEVANHHRGKGWTVRGCVKSKLKDCD